jgi:hypothetical protein
MEMNKVIASATKAEYWLFSLYGPLTPKKETLLTIGYKDGGTSEPVQTGFFFLGGGEKREQNPAFAGNPTPIPRLSSPSREIGIIHNFPMK